MAKLPKGAAFAALIIGIIGFLVIGLHVNWWAAVGVTAMFFGHNIEKHWSE